MLLSFYVKIKTAAEGKLDKESECVFCSRMLLFYHFMMGAKGNKQQSQDLLRQKL